MKKIIVATIITIMLCLSFNLNVYAEGINGDAYSAEKLYKYSKKEDGTIKITGVTEEFYNYYEGEERLILPEMLDGSYVTSVLMRLNVLTTIKEIKIPDKVESIGSHLFEDCTALESVILPSKIKAIGENAFYNCSNLKQIKIPDEVTLIGDLAFAECTSLKKVELPENVQRIGENVFQNCTGLEEIKINNKVTVIKDNAFTGCTSLKEIEIPKSVTKIKVNAFKDCTSLTKVTIKNSSITLENNIFEGVPRVSLASYKNSTSSVYAEGYENINFEEIASEISQVEKAGILMSAFAKECVENDNYSSRFTYTTDNRNNIVFAQKVDNTPVSRITVDCVGAVNLFVYQSTGLWGKDFNEKIQNAPTNDPVYVSPSGIRATDIFEYIPICANGEQYTPEQIQYYATLGKVMPGDIIQLPASGSKGQHVAMFCGLGQKNDDSTREVVGKMMCPEDWSGNNFGKLVYSSINTDRSTWGSTAIVVRIKEEAANELTFLYELNTKEEVEAYGRKLAEAYMQGEAEYKGETLKRKNYGINKVTVGNKTEPVIGTETIDNVEIKTIKNIKGYTVKDIKALEMFAGYSKVEVLDEEGNVITNEDEKMISTAMKVRLYKDITAGQALEIRAGGDTLQEEYVVIIYGDVTGAGKPSAIDALAIVKNATGKIKFNNKIKEIAGRVSKEARKNKTRPTAVDALMIVQEKLGKIEINQGEFTEQEPEVDETSDIIPIYTRADLEKVGSGEEWLVESVGKIYTMKTDAKYVLMKDIDLSEKAWTPIGLPEVKNETGEVIKESTILTNTFEGNNHKITGMTITGEQETKDIGLFAVSQASINHLILEDVNIHDITFYENARSKVETKYSAENIGSIVGTLIGKNEQRINKCQALGNISAQLNLEKNDENVNSIHIGGIIGYITSNDEIVSVENCTNKIKIEGQEEEFCKDLLCVGGIIGGSDSNLSIFNCSNNGDINLKTQTVYGEENNFVSGIVSIIYEGNVKIIKSNNYAEIKGITSSGIVTKTTDYNRSDYTSEHDLKINLTIDNCVNYGYIKGGGAAKAAAGIVAYALGENIVINNSRNEGEIFGNSISGGIIGSVSLIDNLKIYNCKNLNHLIGGESQSISGGILGYICNDNKVKNIEITDCINEKNGNILNSLGESGGIVGIIALINDSDEMLIDNCINKADILLSDYSNDKGNWNVGGIIGHISFEGEELKVINCKNYGDIKGYYGIGGIIGTIGADKSIEIEKCINEGSIYGIQATGGIVGRTLSYDKNDNTAGVTYECVNKGNVYAGKTYVNLENKINATGVGIMIGGIVGENAKMWRYENCENNGAIISYGKVDPNIGGIAGYIVKNKTTIINCKNNGELSLPNYTGDKELCCGEIIGKEN